VRIEDDVEIGANTTVDWATQVGLAGSGRVVPSSPPSRGRLGLYPRVVWSGAPSRPTMEAKRIWAAEKRLPDLLRRVRDLEKRLAELEKGAK
jgi:UDP-3-O-[3-hydroxymyristoyl] glucosamine N-acyltransferase